ncbi:hypothetical protein [uncultured Rikenella sp.]|uniref:hypothetical protein n=1 Tax=uncultured Rikenella sp. TaxID=368003 RepID=UPI0025D0155A|nr:hypothetical protein [uncultured Rikenella sp.]
MPLSFDDLCTKLDAVTSPHARHAACPKNGITTPVENGVKYHFCSNTCQRVHVYNVDNGLLKNRASRRDACDWLLLVEKAGTGSPHGCFVELKKGDAEKAVSQLQDTLKQFQEKGWLQKLTEKHYARIVANSMPANSGNSLIEKAKQVFRKHYHCELQHVRPGQKDMINL